MEHCWNLLRPKWQSDMSKFSTRRKLPGKHLVIVESTPLGNGIIDENVEVSYERPPDKKVEKEKERRKSREA